VAENKKFEKGDPLVVIGRYKMSENGADIVVFGEWIGGGRVFTPAEALAKLQGLEFKQDWIDGKPKVVNS